MIFGSLLADHSVKTVITLNEFLKQRNDADGQLLNCEGLRAAVVPTATDCLSRRVSLISSTIESRCCEIRPCESDTLVIPIVLTLFTLVVCTMSQLFKRAPFTWNSSGPLIPAS